MLFLREGHVLLTEGEIRKRVRMLAQEVSRDYYGCELLLVGILKGAFIFLADLVRCLSIPVRLDFMMVSSYGNSQQSSGNPIVIKDLEQDISGLHVLIVEDIVDTGLSLKFIGEILQNRRPASLKSCVLLDKPSRRLTPLEPDYKGFTIPDEFVVGYGLDFQDKYRNLKDIVILSQETG